MYDNGKQPIKKGDLPEKLTTLDIGGYFENGGKPIEQNDLPDNLCCDYYMIDDCHETIIEPYTKNRFDNMWNWMAFH